MDSTTPSTFWSLVVKNSKPIVHLAGEGDGVPVFLVHAIGGDVGYYAPLAQVAGQGRRVYGIQAPAQKISAEFGHSARALSEYYADCLERFQPAGPIILGGWSAGSVIALEMAQILKRRGREVPLLIIFDGFLYHTGATLSGWNPLYWRKMLRNLPRWMIDTHRKRLTARGILKRLGLEWRLARSYRAIERNRPGDDFAGLLDMSQWPPGRVAFSRALYRSLESYKPELYDGRVLVYVAKTEPFFHLWQVEATWIKVAPAAEFHHVWGFHQEMMYLDRVERMGAHLRDYLAAFTSVPAQCLSGPDSAQMCRNALRSSDQDLPVTRGAV